MGNRHIVSVSYGDHLVFGEGDGRLAEPEAVRRRMAAWKNDLGAAAVHWRMVRSHLEGRYYAARGYRHPSLKTVGTGRWNDLDIVPGLAHEAGLRIYLYVSLFDDGFPLAPKKVRAVSYHNAMHWQHVSWQSRFSCSHPEYALCDRTGTVRQWGVLCLGYAEVRTHFRSRFRGFLEGRGFDGLFVCLRSQSRPADFADQFGFNSPVRDDYLARHGRDICREDFDLQAWRDLNGEYLTVFLSELRKDLDGMNLKLAVGVPRGDVLGPPMGNTTLDWGTWVRNGIVDDLVINQNSSQCPSMWHHLWPMHRGYGYLQNYADGRNMPSLTAQLAENYGPGLAGSEARLYVARQWDERSRETEERLLSQSAVSGLVLSSFRHDNPGPVARGDWRA